MGRKGVCGRQQHGGHHRVVPTTGRYPLLSMRHLTAKPPRPAQDRAQSATVRPHARAVDAAGEAVDAAWDSFLSRASTLNKASAARRRGSKSCGGGPDAPAIAAGSTSIFSRRPPVPASASASCTCSSAVSVTRSPSSSTHSRRHARAPSLKCVLTSARSAARVGVSSAARRMSAPSISLTVVAGILGAMSVSSAESVQLISFCGCGKTRFTNGPAVANPAFRGPARLIDSITPILQACPRTGMRAGRLPRPSRIECGRSDLPRVAGWEHERARSACVINRGRHQPAGYIEFQPNTAPVTASSVDPQPVLVVSRSLQNAHFPRAPHAPSLALSLFVSLASAIGCMLWFMDTTVR